ncbi:MAG: hypothetical protein C0620_11450 [Desulfuromonas sp.]|nr:MAG: hypothetical protein C0620_11450 [Desulfuromonas sp.]
MQKLGFLSYDQETEGYQMTTLPPIQFKTELQPVPLLLAAPQEGYAVGRILNRSERTVIKNTVVGIIQEQRSVLNLLGAQGNISEEAVVSLVGEDGYFGPNCSAERVLTLIATLVRRYVDRSQPVVSEIIDCCRRFQYCAGQDLSLLSEETFERVYEKIATRWMVDLPQNG